MWLPKATAKLPNPPLLSVAAAHMKQTPGISTGLIFQNGAPAFAIPHFEVAVHWLKDAPLRPSNLRAPGKIGNNFAVESFVDELAAAAQRDPLEFRLQAIKDPRGIEVLRRAAALIGWKPHAAPGNGSIGRGIAYIHYKNNENYVAIAMQAQVNRATGVIRVERIACAHDCGLMINPDAVRQQIEGNIYQTLSRTLYEEVKFDQSRVTSVDWASYPILTFPDTPEILIDLVERPNDRPLGVGEAASAPVPAALGNAVFDAIGVRLRQVPFTPQRVKAAIATAGA
jgi:CO/xanthine dehydrogenase Mo-binding subunit